MEEMCVLPTPDMPSRVIRLVGQARKESGGKCMGSVLGGLARSLPKSHSIKKGVCPLAARFGACSGRNRTNSDRARPTFGVTKSGCRAARPVTAGTGGGLSQLEAAGTAVAL